MEGTKQWSRVVRVEKKIINLSEEQACYILITCNKPNVDGKMHVEMTYEGDPGLASYLLENAQGFFDQEEESLSDTSSS